MDGRTGRIEVAGMSCATCSSTIERAVGDLPGVESVDANFATDHVTVRYDPDVATLEGIYDAIEAAGYDPDSRRRTIPVGGMSCATCSTTVADALEGVPGVLEASANFATDEATVTYNPGSTDLEALYEAVEDAGYVPERADDDGHDGQTAVQREVAKQRRLVVGGGILAAPFLLVMVDMVLGGVLPRAVAGVPLAWAEFALATALMATLGREFVRGALRAFVGDRRANMDTLVALGTATAYGYSTAVLLGVVSGGLYFEAVAVILWFITLGNWLEARSKATASAALRSLLELQAEEATLVVDGEEVVVPLDEVTVGDVMKVRPGERIPTDGVVVEGRAAVDESMVTGESVPVQKAEGDEVIGSTINEDGRLLVEATKVGEETAIHQIVERVREAQARQPDIQRLVDRVSAVFVPAVIANALAWFALWLAFPEVLLGVVEWLPLWAPVGGGPAIGAAAGIPVFEFAVVVLASALLIACPCALGLATPAATMVGSTIAATNGVLYRGADVLERARGIDVVVFDKTGTLTRGDMELTDVIAVGDGGVAGRDRVAPDGGALEQVPDERYVLEVAAGAEAGSEHPIAEAIVAAARAEDVPVREPADFENLAGMGVRARLEHGEVLLGNRDLFREHGIDTSSLEGSIESLQRAGKTVTLVAVDGDPIGLLATADTVRPSARETVTALRRRGLRVMMLTGDNDRTARAVAEAVGIDPGDVRAGVLPGDKADAVESIQADGSRAMMVGDGVNDAPALTAAHLGVAIGSGTDVAIESADVTLMRDDPADVLKAIRVADATVRKVKQNLFWAFAYNATLLPVASLGLLNPALAGIAMAASSVSVMANSLAFIRYDPHREYAFLPLRPLARLRRRTLA